MKVKKEMKLIDFLSLSYNRKNVKNIKKYMLMVNKLANLIIY